MRRSGARGRLHRALLLLLLLLLLLRSLQVQLALPRQRAQLLARHNLHVLGQLVGVRAGQTELHLPAHAREVFDVTGAGDTVISTLAVSLAAGADLAEAVVLANIAAGIVVGKLGTAVVSAPELRRAVHQAGGPGRGAMTEEQLLIAIEDARAQGEKIVFTNGCFDIIHAGHVGYLDSARRLGDRVHVAPQVSHATRRRVQPRRLRLPTLIPWLMS